MEVDFDFFMEKYKSNEWSRSEIHLTAYAGQLPGWGMILYCQVKNKAVSEERAVTLFLIHFYSMVCFVLCCVVPNSEVIIP